MDWASGQNADRSLRVALLGPYPLEEGKFRNGVESVTAALGDGLADRGIEVHAVTCVPGINKVARFRTSTGVNVHQIPLFDKLGNLTGYTVDVRRIRAELGEIAPDIVHIHKILIYARAALEVGWPSVLTIHGIHYREAALQRGWTGIRARFASRYEREAVRKANHIICLNRYAADNLRGNLSAGDVRFIDNPIDDRYFSVPHREEPGRLLFGGFITERKNLLGLLEALVLLAKEHPNVKLRVAGKVGDSDYYQRCLNYIAQHNLKDNVDFLGMVSVDGMVDELSKACALILPSKQETAPVIISEAMAAGKPAIATPAGGTAEMVDDGVTGFIVPFDDPEALADAMGRLLNDANLRNTMGKAARQSAELRFRRLVVIDKTLQMYRDIVGEL